MYTLLQGHQPPQQYGYLTSTNFVASMTWLPSALLDRIHSYILLIMVSYIAGQLGVLPTATELLDHQVNQFVEAASADQ